MSESKKDKLLDIFVENLKNDDKKYNNYKFDESSNKNETDINMRTLIKEELENLAVTNDYKDSIIKGLKDSIVNLEINYANQQKLINKLEENFNNICNEIQNEFKNDILTKINEYEI